MIEPAIFIFKINTIIISIHIKVVFRNNFVTISSVIKYIGNISLNLARLLMCCTHYIYIYIGKIL